MGRTQRTPEKRAATPGRKTATGRKGKPPAGEPPRKELTARAMAGDEEAFLALARFHSTFNPLPLTRELLLASGLEEEARARLLGRLQRKEDRLMLPFPGVNMMFWGEEWVQETLGRFLWVKRGRRQTPNEAFLEKLWDATREGAALQLRIYRKARVTPSEWVRVKYPHFANLGLTDVQMLKIARAEGCRFEEAAFLRAIRKLYPKSDSWKDQARRHAAGPEPS
ncbi:MAG: hypothetical protein M1550_06255 [Deltaproteobacteria bacterium]|nr:hypothetical protein [Deltaproteobacteria bacterium]